MSVHPNRRRYLLSLADELHSQATRVRDLIGDSHWYYDGHQKEYLLLDVFKRHLPFGMLASRGFVISPTAPESRSPEQDILVIDALQEAPIFHQGGMIIVFPRMVRAAISVKTTMDSKTIKDSVKGLNSMRDVTNGHIESRLVWCGAYYFEVDGPSMANPLLPYGQISTALKDYPVQRPLTPSAHPRPLGPDLHCSSRDLAYKLDHGYSSDAQTTTAARLLGYRCRGLATALFLGELLDHVAAARGAAASDFSYFTDGEGIEPLTEPSRQL
jgi:hypothetical protein